MFFPQLDESIGIRVRQRPQQHAVRRGQHGRRGPNAESERQDCRDKEGLVAANRREQIADVAAQLIQSHGGILEQTARTSNERTELAVTSVGMKPGMVYH